MGLHPWELGRYTPAEFLAAVEGRQRQMRWMVWHTEALSRMKRLPTFNRFVGGHKLKQEQMTTEDWADLKRQFGII